MQNSYPYTYEDSDELWLKQEEFLENPLENEAELTDIDTASDYIMLQKENGR